MRALQVRMDEADYDWLVREARHNGLSLSAYCRKRLRPDFSDFASQATHDEPEVPAWQEYADVPEFRKQVEALTRAKPQLPYDQAAEQIRLQWEGQ